MKPLPQTSIINIADIIIWLLLLIIIISYKMACSLCKLQYKIQVCVCVQGGGDTKIPTQPLPIYVESGLFCLIVRQCLCYALRDTTVTLGTYIFLLFPFLLFLKSLICEVSDCRSAVLSIVLWSQLIIEQGRERK